MLCKTRLNTEGTRKLPPKYVIHILKTLEGAGYHAVLVGGCVRDTVLGRRPNDWDIATSAPPEDVQRLFARTVPTGIRHGTVTVLYGGGKCEVTTWRVEGAYSDHRRPDSVVFTPSLTEDLARRDFTINAMAMDASGNITDPFGGLADLKRGVIRCVGEPQHRFAEDALRMLRAVRFAAKLGFELDGATLAALLECAPLCADISAERTAGEIRGVLTTPRSDYVWALVDWGLLPGHVNAGASGDGVRRPLASLPKYARLAHWCFELERDVYIMSTRDFLTGLRFDRRTIETCSAAVEILASGRRDYKRLLRDYGRDAVLVAYPKVPEIRRILRSGECWNMSMLRIGGRDLAPLGYSGREMGEELKRLLDHVIDHPDDNESEILRKLASEGR